MHSAVPSSCDQHQIQEPKDQVNVKYNKYADNETGRQLINICILPE